MTPPTIHELAGIFMLALFTALISQPSSGFLRPPATTDERPFAYFEGFTIDGIPDVAFPAR